MLLIAKLHLTFVNKNNLPMVLICSGVGRKIGEASNMKRALLFFLFIFCILSLQAQPKIKDKKYQSLLWEITGNGAKKPSYLIGTMHVSNKVAFHLPDSFYIAIRNAQVVALETNPETWQEDMNRFDIIADNYNAYNRLYSGYRSIPDEYLNINTLKFYKYESKIERALYSNPSSINNLLYRSYGNEASDFEEDTYLDMYIFQCGKKWGKKVTGVENYGESMKLMSEAYKDASKDKNKKERSYDGADEYSIDKLQEAYRSGNLDLLDTINKYNSTSAAFDEKFLYRRNEIQAYSIDSIIRSGSVLFAGVGAAHLPGERGVIEMLRKKGYKLRPVKMGERDSRDKDIVDKIRVPVVFRTTTADDGFFKVDIPGKFYKFGEEEGLDQKQYADMSNGSYYMVTRIMTNAWMWSQSTDDIFRGIDSLLYENVPGKIISKTSIFKNGYKGFDLMSRTRRGDLQQYNIFITPFEIIIFKMSGNGDYLKQGNEANLFFESIKFKEYKAVTEPRAGEWKKYSPSCGGFVVDLPHDPYMGNDGSWIYDAEDNASGTQYRIVRTDIHNFHFVEEDSFDLNLMNESFMASAFIDTQFYSKQTSHKGYPALVGKYKAKGNSVYLTRFIIQGPHYYTLIAHGKKEIPAMHNFLNSFEIKPFIYNEPLLRKDTSLYFTVTTPVYPEDKKIKLDIPRYSFTGPDADHEDSEDEQLYGGAYRNKTISHDTTGEKIYVSFYRSPRYYYKKDSAINGLIKEASFFTDPACIYKIKKKTELPDKKTPDGYRVWETVVTDTGSSRILWTKTFYKDGMVFSLATESDTLTQPSGFLKNFFETFTPADSLKGINPFVKKSNLFFDDFMNKDSIKHKRAVKHMDDIELDAADLPQLKKTIAGLNWGEKKYLGTKRSLIYKLGEIPTSASSDYLKGLYYALDDTVQLQYAVLGSLLEHKTNHAFNNFRDIINTEPPVVKAGSMDRDFVREPISSKWGTRPYRVINNNFLDKLSDSLQLAKTILPDLLPLLNLEDYKNSIMKLLGEMVDSNLVKPDDYKMYFTKFLVEARQELKKQSIAEKKKAIENAEESKEKRKIVKYYSDDEKDPGNDDLHLYATLLLPFRETNPSVQSLIEQMLKSKDKKLKYNTLLLLLQHQQPFPDSLLNYFGSLDDYRYKLYHDLKRLKSQERFPKKYNNHLDLGRSLLLGKKTYDMPDTVVFIDRLGAHIKDKKGVIYFYKYKTRKDDLSWKLAMVGLVPEDPDRFEFEDGFKTSIPIHYLTYFPLDHFPYDFTDFTTTRFETDEPIAEQLNKALKKLLYSRRNSARKFYAEDNDRTVMTNYID